MNQLVPFTDRAPALVRAAGDAQAVNRLTNAGPVHHTDDTRGKSQMSDAERRERGQH
jgi:hypothetical protein